MFKKLNGGPKICLIFGINLFDIKTILLNGDIQKEVYMHQPKGYVSHNNELMVCKLRKTLYHVKQAFKT